MKTKKEVILALEVAESIKPQGTKREIEIKKAHKRGLIFGLKFVLSDSPKPNSGNQ